MSDFTSSFWSIAIAVISLIGIIACAWIAWHFGRRTPKDIKALSPGGAVAQTGHEWDGITEYDNPLPRWWVWMFYIMVAWALIYLVLYPGLGAYKGTLGWTQVNQYEAERERLDARIEVAYAEFSGLSPLQLAENERALNSAHSLFLNNCAQCHGSDARGSRGYPNLSDGDWLWGGTPEAIYTTIAKGRHGIMPPQSIGDATAVRNVAAYVQSLSGVAHNASAAVLGRPLFEQTCAACHGADGTGNQALGAPNLTDKVWLYGGSQADIMNSILHGREGVMPAHEGRLTEQQINLLVGYLMNISGEAKRQSEAQP